jgi:hypothetical protein
LVNRDFTDDRSTPQTSPSKRNQWSNARENARKPPVLGFRYSEFSFRIVLADVNITAGI